MDSVRANPHTSPAMKYIIASIAALTHTENGNAGYNQFCPPVLMGCSHPDDNQRRYRYYRAHKPKNGKPMESGMPLFQMVANELTLIRADLQELKRCQLAYFTLAITGTSGILGILAPLKLSNWQPASSNLAALALLAPLLILLPCWLIFFDKATTITRLVGYQRALEHIIAPNGSAIRYVGLENALSIMRQAEPYLDATAPVGNERSSTILDLIILRKRHRYWMINWYTFATLAFISCTLGYNCLGLVEQTLLFPLGLRVILPERTLWGGGAFLIFIVTSVYTLSQVWRITIGKMSYDAYAKKWLRALAPKKIQEFREEITLLYPDIS